VVSRILCDPRGPPIAAPSTIRSRDLRHAAATFALSQGFTLEDLKQLLGHSSIVLTSHAYGHVLEQRQRAVAMGMDAVLGAVPGG
jgi:integrase